MSIERCSPCETRKTEALAQAAVASCEARKDEDVDAWATRLAADSVAMGEAEYGPNYARMDRPWPLHDVVRKLADMADHLMDVHGCDAHGYESVLAARDAARSWLVDFDECTETERLGAIETFERIARLVEHDSPACLLAVEQHAVLMHEHRYKMKRTLPNEGDVLAVPNTRGASDDPRPSMESDQEGQVLGEASQAPSDPGAHGGAAPDLPVPAADPGGRSSVRLLTCPHCEGSGQLRGHWGTARCDACRTADSFTPHISKAPAHTAVFDEKVIAVLRMHGVAGTQGLMRSLSSLIFNEIVATTKEHP